MHSPQLGSYAMTFCAAVGLISLAACGPLGGVDGVDATGGAGGQPAVGASGAGEAAVVLPDPPAFKVVGYQPSWSGSINTVPFSKLNYVNYAFATEGKDGSVALPQPTQPIAGLVSLGHAAGVRVLLSIGGWNNGDDSAFATLAASPDARAKFATALDGIVDQFKLDGVDLDWEYPGASDADSYTAMVRELSAKLKPKGKLITIAAAPSNDGSQGVTAEALQYIDLVNIMAYDGGRGAGHSPFELAQNAIQFWLSKGCPPAKAIIGVPFYSKPDNTPYSTLVTQNPQAAMQDELVVNPLDPSKTQYYNGIPTVQAKTALAMATAGGVMAWDLSQDARQSDLSLVSAIYSKSHPGM